MSGPIVRWLHRHDPEWYALHKAVKVAIAVTVGLAVGTATGNGQLSLFASFGGVALLLFADFPGSSVTRLGSYIGLTVTGAVLITLGTLASSIAWLAVLGMAIVGFLVLFSGVLSAAIAGATRASLLTFILPVTVIGSPGDIPWRWPCHWRSWSGRRAITTNCGRVLPRPAPPWPGSSLRRPSGRHRPTAR